MKEFQIEMDVASNKYLVVEVGQEVNINNAIAEGDNKSTAMRNGLSNIKQWNKMTNNQEEFIIYFDYEATMQKEQEEDNHESNK